MESKKKKKVKKNVRSFDSSFRLLMEFLCCNNTTWGLFVECQQEMEDVTRLTSQINWFETLIPVWTWTRIKMVGRQSGHVYNRIHHSLDVLLSFIASCQLVRVNMSSPNSCFDIDIIIF